jgi:hypothetical protein
VEEEAKDKMDGLFGNGEYKRKLQNSRRTSNQL